MVIDCHAHIAWRPLYSTRFMAGILRGLLAGFDDSTTNGRGERAERLLGRFLSDQWCDGLVRQMELAGIAKAVLLILPDTDGPERQLMSRRAVYEHHYEVLRRHPNRLLVFAGVDPRDGPDGLELFRTSVREWGFRGLKLYPPLGYRVDDDRFDPYYAICDAYGLPVVIHTGPSLPELDASLAHSHHVSPVARRWPRVNFILAHAGFRLDTDSVNLATTYRNVYLDIAGFRSRYTRLEGETVAEFGRIFRDNLHDKILFGTDWPLFNLLSPPSRDIEFINELFRETEHHGDPRRLEGVLSGNARRSIGIE